MLEPHSFFTDMVDELVEFSEYDPDLADGLRWIDEQAWKNGRTLYEQVFVVLHKYDVDQKAKEWLDSKKEGVPKYENKNDALENTPYRN